MSAPPPAHPLVVRDVSITHDGAADPTPAGVSFEVRAGEVVLLLGPSGSGKSTLALSMNGLIPHAVPADLEGTVTVGGLDTAHEPVARLATRAAMVFQDPDAQLVTGTVLDEVAFGPENLRVHAEDVLARAEAALRRVGLWDRRDANPDTLSGGGRQRLAIACALAMDTPLIVLDEPTANLDPAGIDDVYAALADLVATRDRAIVLVEHNLDAAVGLVDRVVVLDQPGRLVADGPVDEVLRGQAAHLHDLGVWLPTATLAALRLRRAGYALDPLPLTPAELRAALEAHAPVGAGAPATPAVPAVHTGGDTHSGGSDPGIRPSETHNSSETPSPSLRPASPTPTRPEPLIRVRGLTVHRRRARILHDVDLDVAAGEFLAVVGPNGAGKTTLVQAIAGVVAPPRGAVRIGDLDPGRADVRHLSRQVGFVFQNPEHQFIAPTVHDEIAHGLRRQGLSASEVTARVDDILHRFGLADRADAHPFLLSGGQKRRLSVGTALVGGAPVLALDEPTFGQDRARAEELLALLDDLHRTGTTIIVVTHDMQLVTEHATHIAVLTGGRLRAHGPTAAVFADDDLLRATGLRRPPLAEALHGLHDHPALADVVRLGDLPRAGRDAA